VAYWDLIEPTQGEYNFSDLDWQMAEAQSHHAKVILAVGQRVPRWPECHFPAWTANLSQAQREQALLDYLQAITNHYKNQPALVIWQVENEPFLQIFGQCPPRNKPLLLQELALVRKNDPAHPTMVTDSGEEATWFRTRNLADYLGTSVYRMTYILFGRYVSQDQIIPASYYRFKAWWIFKPIDKIIVSELQAEPWSQQSLVKTPQEQQEKGMNLAQFEKNIAFSRNLGLSQVYLWGVEWWYWQKTQGNSSYWNEAKTLFQ
jgi:hypothetical protein